ncbi:MAG: type II toxin-antitoxin system HicA family toxin [Bacteroidales bacterium]|nr:type II toxin-antitoxin system HicA family toxin [Bacteroidales bacterium]
MRNLSNVSISEFRAIMLLLGLSKVRTKGGHEAWMKAGMTRPAIVQTHVDPVPEYVLRNNLRIIGISREEFLTLLEKL